MRLPTSLRTLAESLARLPSIGPRQAIRLALHLSSLAREDQRRFADALSALENIRRCAECFFPYEGAGERCEICANPERSPKTVMVVEKETDLLSLEKTGRYAGRYLIVGTLPRGGTISDGQRALLERRAALAQAQGGIDELILALSGTASGEHLGAAVSAMLSPVSRKVTRLGRGLPRGAEIEFADEDTLGYSLESRH